MFFFIFVVCRYSTCTNAVKVSRLMQMSCLNLQLSRLILEAFRSVLIKSSLPCKGSYGSFR